MAKTFKDSKPARDRQQERRQRERKQYKTHGRNTEELLWKRMWNSELLTA